MFGLALGAGSAARAADLCFGAGLYSFVGKGFKVPAKGRCKPFSGRKESLFGGTSVVSGTACTPLVGDFVDFNLVSQPSGDIGTLFEAVRMPLHAGGPSSYSYEDLSGSSATSQSATVPGVCNVPYVP